MKLLYKVLITIILLGILLFIVNGYSNRIDPVVDAARFSYHNNELVEIEGTVYEQLNDREFYFNIFGFEKPVLVISKSIQLGRLPENQISSLSIQGFFNSDGIFYLTNYRVAYFIILKYIISFIAFIWFIFIFFSEWKLTWRGFKDA